VSWPNNPVNASRFPSGASVTLNGSLNPGLNTPLGQTFTATNISGNSFDVSAPGALDGTFSLANDPNLQFEWWAGDIGGCPDQPCSPPVPNDALIQMTNWLHATSAVPISWPASGGSSLATITNWIGKGSLSDYASHYWIPYSARHTYAWAQGIQELGYWMTEAYYSRQEYVMLDRPQIMLVSMMGPVYWKGTSGAAYYSPLQDTLSQPGVSGAAVSATMMTAAAIGAAGVRLYAFENSADENGRASAATGAYFQTGASPTTNDQLMQEIWKGASAAATALTGVLQPFILGTAMDSPAYGPNLVSAVRQASSGTMLMIVNDNDWRRVVPVDFTSFSLGRKIQRFVIGADGSTGPLAPSSSSGEMITLNAGDTVVYLFLNK
jgi:hypothetical protein